MSNPGDLCTKIKPHKDFGEAGFRVDDEVAVSVIGMERRGTEIAAAIFGIIILLGVIAGIAICIGMCMNNYWNTRVGIMQGPQLNTVTQFNASPSPPPYIHNQAMDDPGDPPPPYSLTSPATPQSTPPPPYPGSSRK
ncbi:cysteine and tyrosine-rich protein 1 [Rhinoraja longicauda]